MASKQEAKKETGAFFQQAAEARRQLACQRELTVSTSLWAVLSGWPTGFLEKAGILAVPEEEETRIVVTENRYELLQAAFAWANEDDKAQKRVLGDLYLALFQVSQASVRPGVVIKDVLEPHRDLISLSSEKFPPLKGLVDHVEKGGWLGSTDQESLSGVARSIFGRLGKDRTEELRASGRSPEFMFTSSGNA